jgi:predicted nuclease with TOPRIM domain
MDNTIIIALISFAGTLLGTFGGIITSNKLTTYRIEQLEKKVEKHNNVIERVHELETEKAVFEEELKVANNRIKDLEQYHK